jgi:hypothetical protein
MIGLYVGYGTTKRIVTEILIEEGVSPDQIAPINSLDELSQDKTRLLITDHPDQVKLKIPVYRPSQTYKLIEQIKPYLDRKTF